MSDYKLGKILTGTELRDAIHVAIAPVQAGGHLAPGWHVGLEPDGKASINATPHIGIVDPFLTHGIEAGQWFYLCLYQQTVTGMRHHWLHPAFTDTANNPIVISTADKEASWAWMRRFAQEHHSNSSYYNGFDGSYTAEMLIEHASEYLSSGDVHIQAGDESLRDAMWDRERNAEFWRHFSVITGMQVADDMSDCVPFSCSC